MQHRLKQVGLALLAVFAIFAVAIPEEAQVTTAERTEVKDTDYVNARTIAVLPKGVTFDVHQCDDVKSYFLYKIKLPDGRFGYVGYDPIPLKVGPAWRNLWKPPLVWNCY